MGSILTSNSRGCWIEVVRLRVAGFPPLCILCLHVGSKVHAGNTAFGHVSYMYQTLLKDSGQAGQMAVSHVG